MTRLLIWMIRILIDPCLVWKHYIMVNPFYSTRVVMVVIVLLTILLEQTIFKSSNLVYPHIIGIEAIYLKRRRIALLLMIPRVFISRWILLCLLHFAVLTVLISKTHQLGNPLQRNPRHDPVWNASAIIAADAHVATSKCTHHQYNELLREREFCLPFLSSESR